jgi:glycerol-3-phosphate O-acyltransferase
MSAAKPPRTYDPPSVLAAAYRRFFEHLQIDEAWLRVVREAATRGPLVYVLRNLAFLDFMALDYATKKHGLPQLGFANDLGMWVLEPFAETWSEALMLSRRPEPAARLARVIESGGSAALFLKRPPSFLEKATRRRPRHVSAEGDTLVRVLLELQRGLDRPIMLVPQVFVWTMRPGALEPSAIDFVLGPREWPGAVRISAQFLLNYRHAMLRAGEPLSLSDFLASNAGETDDTLVRRVTYALLRKVERERRAILGPVRKPADRVRDEIVRSPKLQATIAHLAGEGPAERMLLTARAYRMLRDMEAAPDTEIVAALTSAFRGVLHRIYAGVEIDREGLDRVREAASRGSVVLLPSHKSHMDYLLLSHVLHAEALQLPLIAAGDNLSFFPAGPILRRGGAFFIRRSFHGDRLYVAVVDAYLRRLIRDGWPIELFPEGTRSRTGKLLSPKLGLLNMIIESALSLSNREVFFVPVSIGYERLLEEGSYVRELLGAEKTKENPTALIRALGVLAERYGRLNVQFGEILSLREAARALPARAGGELAPAQRRELTKRVAYQVMAEINAAAAATPGAVVALALLSHGRRGVSLAEIETRVRQLAAVLRSLGARMTPSLAAPSGALQPTCVREAIAMLLKAKLLAAHVAGASLPVEQGGEAQHHGPDDVIYVVPEPKRIALDISKNIIVHFFVPSAFLATALRAAPGPPASRASVRERVQRLSRLFKHEFMFRADSSFEANFDDALDRMVRRGELVLEGGEMLGLGPGHDGLDGRGWVALYASMIRNFLESYRVAARALALLLKGPATRRELVRKALALGDRMCLAGEIERREALSTPCIENAFQSLIDQGYLRPEEGRRLSLASSFRDPEAVRAIERQIAGHAALGPDDAP